MAIKLEGNELKESCYKCEMECDCEDCCEDYYDCHDYAEAYLDEDEWEGCGKICLCCVGCEVNEDGHS